MKKIFYSVALFALSSCTNLTTTPPTSVTLSAARRLTVETAANGTGTTISAQTLNYAGTLTAYATLRDGNGTFVSNPTVSWSLSSAIGSLSSSSGSSTTLTITAASGSATLSATESSAGTSASGTLTVSFAPTNVSGLTLWLDANSTAMTALAYANGEAVTLWPDSSTSGNRATQLTAAARPLFETNAVNSKNAVKFDGVNDVMTLKTSVAMQPGTFIVVGKSNNAANAGPYLGHSGGSVLFGYDGAGNMTITDGTTPLTGARINPITTFEIMTLTSDSAGGTHNAYANGTVSIANGTPNWGAVAYDQLGADAAATWFDGWIAEILVYSSALGATDLSAVHNYLASKYGLTLGL